MSISIELYVLLIVISIILISYFVYLKISKRINKNQKKLLNEKVGNYRFADMNNILITTYIELPEHLKNHIELTEIDLLMCFKLFIPQLSSGIEWDHPTEDGVFIYYHLGPKLMAYGLCEKVPSINNDSDGAINSYLIRTSEAGYKFFALLETSDRFYNRKFYKLENEKRQKTINNALEKLTINNR